MEKKQKIKSIIIAISLLLFFVSLFMPVYEGQWNEGWTMLSIGWLSTLFFMQNPWQLVWFANPLYFLAIYYWVKDRKSQRYRVALTSVVS